MAVPLLQKKIVKKRVKKFKRVWSDRLVTVKVQAVAWNHYQPQVLFSGSFDHTVVMRDGRTPSHSGIKWSVNVDVENVTWDPQTEHSFVVLVGKEAS